VAARARDLAAGAPAATHCTSVANSPSESRASLAKWPTWGSAYQGGMVRTVTSSRIALAHGRAAR
jgi:hypothetical protein